MDATPGPRAPQDRDLDQLLSDYILFGDLSAGADLIARADDLKKALKDRS